MSKKCPYSEIFLAAFSRIWTAPGEISPYSVGMLEITDQKNSEYGHFSSSDHTYYYQILVKNIIYCNFYLWSNGKTDIDKFLVRIKLDTALCKTMMKKQWNFWQSSSPGTFYSKTWSQNWEQDHAAADLQSFA